MSAAQSVPKSGTDRSVLTSPTADDDEDFEEPTPRDKGPAKQGRRKQCRKSLGSDFDSVAASPAADASAIADAEMEQVEDAEDKKSRNPANWVRLQTWETISYSHAEILHECKQIGNAKLRAAGIDKLPATHKPMPSDLGNWKFKDPTTTELGACLTHYYRCPLAHRTKCPHKLRILYYAGSAHLEITEGHESFEHDDVNKKRLGWKQINAIAAAVRVAPNQTASSIRRNLGNFASPTKEVTPQFLPSVRRLVSKVRDDITKVNLNGIEVDGSYGSLTELCKAIDFRKAVKRHNDPDVPYHIDMFETVCIGHDIDAGSNVLFMALTNIWMLCEIARIRNSNWALQIQGDGTFKLCAENVCLLGLGVNRIGAHFHPIALLIVPDGAETEDAWTQLWRCVRHAIHRLFTKFQPCILADCSTCRTIRDIMGEEAWSTIVRSEPFLKDFKIEVDYSSGDNNWPWSNFSTNELGLSALVCSSHLTGTLFHYCGFDFVLTLCHVFSYREVYPQVPILLQGPGQL